MSFEGIEAIGPLGAVRLEPYVQFSERFCAEAVEPPLRVASDFDQSCLAQHLEMTGDAGLRHTDDLDEVADGALAGSDGIEDAPAGRFGDGSQHGGRGHIFSMRLHIYTRTDIYEKARSQCLEHGGDEAARAVAGRSRNGQTGSMDQRMSDDELRRAIRVLRERADLARSEGRTEDNVTIERTIQQYQEEMAQRL